MTSHTALYGSCLLLAACALDFDAKQGRRADSDARAADPADAEADAGDDIVTPQEHEASDAETVEQEDTRTPSDGAPADDGHVDATVTDAGNDAQLVEAGDAAPTLVDECTLGLHDCTSAYPCVDTPTGFGCLGRSVAWPMPERTLSGSPESRGLRVDLTNDLIFDERTGLEWRRSSSSAEFDGAGAARYCAELAPPGTWRLPGVAELFSLRPAPPSTGWDDNALPVLTDDWVWTDAVSSQGRWDMNLARGMFGPANPVDRSPALCVRTRDARFDRPLAERFAIDGGADAVIDRATKLVWKRTVPSEPMTFAAAGAYCASLQADTPYRLPSVAEYVSVLDFANQRVLAPWLGVGTAQGYFWSRDTRTDPTYGAVAEVLVFGDRFNVLGFSQEAPPQLWEFGVRCVRTAQ